MHNPLFSASDARKLGVHPSLLHYYVKKHLIERLGRGVYRGSEAVYDVDFLWEDLILTAKSVPNGVVCLLSALALYDLTDEITRESWIAIPHGTTAPIREKTKFIRMRNHTTGVTSIFIGKESITIFDRERTIIDTFRYLSKETAIKVLKEAFKSSQKTKLDVRKLRQYAHKFRINIDTYILVIST